LLFTLPLPTDLIVQNRVTVIPLFPAQLDVLIPCTIGSCTPYRKCRILPALTTWHVKLPGLFQRYKRRCSSTFTNFTSRWHRAADLLLLLLNPPPGPPSCTLALTWKTSVPPSIPTVYSYATFSSWITINLNTY